MNLQTTDKMLKFLTDVNNTINTFNKNKDNIELKKQVVDKLMLLSDELKKTDIKYVTWDDGYDLLKITSSIEIFIFNDLIDGPKEFYDKICTRYNREVLEEKLNVVIDFVAELPDILKYEEDMQFKPFYDNVKKYWDSLSRGWWPSNKIPIYYKPKEHIKGRYRQGIKEEEKKNLQRNIFYALTSWNKNKKSMLKTKSGVCLNTTKTSLIDCSVPSHRVTIAKYYYGKNKMCYLVKQENWEDEHRSNVEEYFRRMR